MKRNTTAIGIEIGATSSVAILADSQGSVIATARGSGLVAGSVADFRQVLWQLRKRLGVKGKRDLRLVRQVVICMAGTSLNSSKGGAVSQVAKECRAAGIRVRPKIYPDIFSTLANELGAEPGIVVVAGTGSCVLAQDGKGHARRCGGWGQRLGDEGSGYAIGLAALRAVLAAQDGLIPPTSLRNVILRTLGLRCPGDVIAWAHCAAKSQIARVAPSVFACAEKGDACAIKIVKEARSEILAQIKPLAVWLGESHARAKKVVLTGGILENQPEFSASIADEIHRLLGPVAVTVSKGTKGKGAMRLALGRVLPPVLIEPAQRYVPWTESPNTASLGIDRQESERIVQIIQEEDAKISPVLLSQRRSLAKAVDWIAEAIAKGGRVFYVGAGTSGRLAALDAAELPPTFGLPAGVFEVIMAGGIAALVRSIEGAEDDTTGAKEQLQSKDLCRQDVVIAISASGTTPFVLAAIDYAKKTRAKTIAITCNPKTPLQQACDLAVVACVGPEVVAGSTRMKAGTATKLILNTLSTAVMIRLGKVFDQWMVEVSPQNEKLRRRAARIVQGLRRCSAQKACTLLETAQGNIKAAVLMDQKKISLADADACLKQNSGNLRKALSSGVRIQKSE